MTASLASVFTAFGLSTAAGLNAYLPLLIVALLARFTNLVTLREPWDVLASWPVIAVLTVLLIVELVADKIPVVDHANDVIQTVIRPASGAILFAANSNLVSDVSPVLAVILGILAAGSMHAAKASFRPVVTATTGGLGNPVVSTVEDVASGLLSFMAILLPLITFVLLILVLFMAWRLWRKWRTPRPADEFVIPSG